MEGRDRVVIVGWSATSASKGSPSRRRRQEIGLRVALGASPRVLLESIVGQGMLLAGLGVIAGLAAALVLTSSMQGVLFDIRASDPLTFLQVAVVMMAAALVSSWLPARRALAIDPVTALRNT